MTTVYSRILFVFSVLAVLASCTGYSSSEKKKFDKEIQVFMKKENLHLTKTASGVYYKVVNVGKVGNDRKILYNDQIRVMYKGKKMDGTIFDERNTPVTLNLKNLIPAWKEVLIGKTAGSVFYIATPPQMGYGSAQAGDIPPNSCLFFEIKVMSTL